MRLKLRAAVPAVVGLGLAVTGVVAQRAQTQAARNIRDTHREWLRGSGALCRLCHGEIASHFSKDRYGPVLLSAKT